MVVTSISLTMAKRIAHVQYLRREHWEELSDAGRYLLARAERAFRTEDSIEVPANDMIAAAEAWLVLARKR